jgi:type IV pilus assembly protein PilX
MGAESAARGVEAIIWNKSNDPAQPTFHCGATGGDDHCYQITNTLGGGTGSMINPLVTTFRTQRGWPSDTSADGAAPYATPLTGLSGTQATASLQKQPRYMVEDLGLLLAPGVLPNCTGGRRLPCGDSGTMHLMRITARATGGNSNSVATVESYFAANLP